jgi:nitrate reductase NapE
MAHRTHAKRSMSATPPLAPSADSAPPPAPSTRQEELRSFLFFTVVMAPVLAVIVVGGYGFLVWMYQLIAGPPQG